MWYLIVAVMGAIVGATSTFVWYARIRAEEAKLAASIKSAEQTAKKKIGL